MRHPRRIRTSFFPLTPINRFETIQRSESLTLRSWCCHSPLFFDARVTNWSTVRKYRFSFSNAFCDLVSLGSAARMIRRDLSDADR